jgi:V/A-type H+-transporting ATPase subunit E
MSQQVQELIDKIKKEGIAEAEQRAQGIEREAHKKAEDIISQAQRHAQDLIAGAKEEGRKLQEAAQTAVRQASRNMILNLRKEIEETLRRIVSQKVAQGLTPDVLVEIIREAVKGYLQNNARAGDSIVTLSRKDLPRLRDGFVAELKEKLKSPLTLKAADDIGAGFTISFDAGRSCFDFTDASLAEYLSGYLNAEVALLLKEAVSA